MSCNKKNEPQPHLCGVGAQSFYDPPISLCRQERGCLPAGPSCTRWASNPSRLCTACLLRRAAQQKGSLITIDPRHFSCLEDDLIVRRAEAGQTWKLEPSCPQTLETHTRLMPLTLLKKKNCFPRVFNWYLLFSPYLP